MSTTNSARAQISVLEKDADLLATLMRLCDHWGESAFDVVDHWEANLNGVGLARTEDHSVLVYIDNFVESKDTYHVALENPPASGSEQPFALAGTHEALSFEDLSSLVGQHLRLTRPEPEAETRC